MEIKIFLCEICCTFPLSPHCFLWKHKHLLHTELETLLMDCVYLIVFLNLPVRPAVFMDVIAAMSILYLFANFLVI